MSTGIKIIDYPRIEVTREATLDEWDGDDTNEIHDIEGFTIVNENGYYDLKVPFEIDKNKTYYLVYVIYSSGDSFHHEESRIDFIELYEDVKMAKEVAKIIEDDYRNWESTEKDWSVEIFNSNGEKYKIHCPWKGYFERLSYAEVEAISCSIDADY